MNLEESNIINYLNSFDLFKSEIFLLVSVTIIILIYSLFTFFSWKIFSRKNLFEFNFHKYIKEGSYLSSFKGFFLYIIEYVIILPVFIMSWFVFYSLFFLLLAKNLDTRIILVLSTALICSIRICAFISHSLSQDLAKMLPIAFLILAITGENFFSLEKTISRLGEISLLINSIGIYLIFIFFVEMLLRVIEGIRVFIKKE